MRHIKLFEQFINEGRIKFNDLVDTNFTIEIGSGSQRGMWDVNELKGEIELAIKHYLFDWEFYYNWTNKDSEYESAFKKDVLEPALKNIDKTLNNMFRFKGGKLTFKLKDEAEAWIDNWFKTNRSISKQLRNDYYAYREEYAGVKL